MISCLNPTILINPAVYEAVAFSHKVVCNGVVRYFNGVSRLFRHSLFMYLRDLQDSITQDVLDLYFTFDRFGHKIGLYIACECRKCILCCQRDENEISQRLIMESDCYKDEPYFITLTFGSWSLPKNNMPTIRHIQTYIKRLRDIVSHKFQNTPIRFYAQGEHGTKRGRAHLHCLIFGLPTLPHCTAFSLFQSAWLTNKYYSHKDSCGRIVRDRLPIGNVYVSQINDPNYRAWYEYTKKRPLRPEDGLRYCCKYSSKESLCRSWSLGLGKKKALQIAYKVREIAKNSFIRPDWKLFYQNKYGKLQQVIISRWFLHTCFDTFNRKTYYYRKKVYDYLNYFVSTYRNFYDYEELLKPLTSLIGVNLCDLSVKYCRKSFKNERSKYCTDLVKLQKWFSSLDSPIWKENLKGLPLSYFSDESRLYFNFCQLYFGNKPEINAQTLSLKKYQREKYLNKSLTLNTL